MNKIFFLSLSFFFSSLFFLCCTEFEFSFFGGQSLFSLTYCFSGRQCCFFFFCLSYSISLVVKLKIKSDYLKRWMLMMLIQLDVAKKNDCDGYWGLVVVITMDGDNKRMDRWMNEWGCKKKD